MSVFTVRCGMCPWPHGMVFTNPRGAARALAKHHYDKHPAYPTDADRRKHTKRSGPEPITTGDIFDGG